jgi:hypothetical protein
MKPPTEKNISSVAKLRESEVRKMKKKNINMVSLTPTMALLSDQRLLASLTLINNTGPG